MKLPAIPKRQAPDQKIEIDISSKTVVRVMVVVVLTLIGLSALNKVSNALILIFLAFFLALALNAPVHWIAEHLPGKKRGSRSVATSISFLIVIALLVGFIALVVPPAARQITSFINSVPDLVREASDQDSPLGNFIQENNLTDVANEFSSDLSSALKSSGGHALSTLSTVGSGIVALFTVLALTFMMLVEGPYWIRRAKSLLPAEKREHAAGLTRDMYRVVRGYVNGQVTLAFIAAVMILPVMLILDVPYAGALAPIIFICGLIPMIGHFIGAAIVTTVALFESAASAILILSFYILYQQIENYVIQPKIQANATNMSPLLVFSAVLIGINLNGLIGGLVAIPIAGCIRILVMDYLRSRGKLSKQEKQELTAVAK